MLHHSVREPLLALHISGQCDSEDPPDEGDSSRVAPGPLIAYLELLAACNNRCVGCCNEPTFHQVLHRRGMLRFDQWAMIIKRLLPNLRRVKLTGGEATLHPDFAEIVTLLDDMAMPFDLFTNGRWLDPDGLVRLLAHATHFGGCLISLHGPTAESHEGFSDVPGCFEETVRNIRLATAGGVPVVLSCIITQKNYALIDDLLALAEEMAVSHIVFSRYVGLPLPGISPTPFQLMQAVRHIDKRKAEGHRIQFSVCIPQCFVPSSSQGCVAGTAASTIDPWGNMRPCNHAPLIAGNLLRQELNEVWHSDAMQEWRKAPDECSSCAAFSTCRGGCRAQAMLTANKYDSLMTKAPGQPNVIFHATWANGTIPVSQEVQIVC